jgi:hypothetical protein
MKNEKRWNPYQLVKTLIVLSMLAVFIVLLFAPMGAQIIRTLNRTTRHEHLVQLGQALLRANQEKVKLTQAICKPDGTPLLSWRVAILPYLNDPSAQALYKHFRLDEPWDSPSNLVLMKRMPTVFNCPGMDVPAYHTCFQVFVTAASYTKGKFRPLWNVHTPMNHEGDFTTIPDGDKDTILVAEVGTPVPWTKPEDIVIDETIEDDSSGFGFKVDMHQFLPGEVYFEAYMANGSLRTMSMSAYVEKNKFMKKLIRPFIGCGDGEKADETVQ